MYKVVGTRGIVDFIGYKETEQEALELAVNWQQMGLTCVITKEMIQ